MAPVEVKQEDLDNMTKALLHDVEPIKAVIADLISSMISKARRTGLTDTTQSLKGYPSIVSSKQS